LIDAGGAGPEGALNMTASAAGDAGGARFEVLVGWSAQDFGGRIVLRTETFEGGQQHRPEQPMHTHVFMTREQATLLANYLFLLTGQSRPEAPRADDTLVLAV
jgi:hypothetical protein